MHTFKKNERLGNYRLQQILFTRGKHFFHYPFRVVYFCCPKNEMAHLYPEPLMPGSARFRYPAKLLVGVSRKNIRKAVNRNRIKRLVKEGYRKNKSLFYPFLERKQACCLLGMIYVGREMPAYEHTKDSLQEALAMLTERIDKEGPDRLGDVRQIRDK